MTGEWHCAGFPVQCQAQAKGLYGGTFRPSDEHRFYGYAEHLAGFCPEEQFHEVAQVKYGFNIVGGNSAEL